MAPSAVEPEKQGEDALTSLKTTVSKSLASIISDGQSTDDHKLGQTKHSLPFRHIPQPHFELEDHPVDVVRTLKVCRS
jgi:hypothetical protein